MRGACTIVVVWALLLGFIEAPFVHVHEQALGEDHHTAEQAHFHAPHIAATTGPAFDTIDPADDERLVNWYQPVPHGGFAPYVLPRQSVIAAPVVAGGIARPAPEVRGHDPPVISSLPARAPPANPA